MKQESVPPSPRPIVIRQAWMLTLPDGTRHDMGHSFHLLEEDRVAYVSETLAAYSLDFRAEPIGEPDPIHVTEEQYALIRATRHGLRVG